MSVEEYLRLRQVVNQDSNPSPTDLMDRVPTTKEIVKAKRKPSAYSRRYKAAFKKVSGKYKLKNGNWKSNGFRSAVRAAHKMVGGKR